MKTARYRCYSLILSNLKLAIRSRARALEPKEIPDQGEAGCDISWEPRPGPGPR
jgi:hypothetical protein